VSFIYTLQDLDMCERDNNITYEELMSERHTGIHVLKENPMIAYKKVNCSTIFSNGLLNMFSRVTGIGYETNDKCIATVRLPVGATIVRPYTYDSYYRTREICSKMRTDTYEVLAIEPLYLEGTNILSRTVLKASSIHDRSFGYEINKTYKVNLNKSDNIDCGPGLHFFRNKTEAENYQG
jgi:hypothetical protein